MRLKPPVNESDALAWLKSQVIAAWDVEITPVLEQNLRSTAAAMAAVSAVELPEEIEPLLL